MKTFLKIILSIAIIFALIISGTAFYMTRNLETGLKIENVDLSSVEDGTYNGEYKAGRFSNEVKVTVKDHKITGIEIVKDVTFNKPEWTKVVIDKVLEAQNTDIDIVSGATVTTKAYLKAIDNALSSK